MGGRSRKQTLPDRWDWVKELTDSRLDSYGRMSNHKLLSHEDNGHSKAALNGECALEFERRHGYKPTWAYGNNLLNQALRKE